MEKTEVIERHSKASPDHQRKQQKNYGEVGQPLTKIIRLGLFFTGPLHAQMIGNDARDRSPRSIILR